MRRTLVALILSVSILASCPPYDSPAGAAAPPAAQPARSGTDPCRPGDKPCWEAHIELQRIWMTEVRAQAERARIARLYAFAVAVERARLEREALHGYPAPRPVGGGLLMGSGRCGPAWGLPPCQRLKTESGGIINVYFGGCNHQCHPRNTAQGKWAFVNRTWAGYRGYRTAALAPEWVQDEKARQLWAGGRGCSHWSACHMR